MLNLPVSGSRVWCRLIVLRGPYDPAKVSVMSPTPGSRLGAYEVTGVLGAGGMGEVYRARDTSLNRDVAIKVLAGAVAGDPDRLQSRLWSDDSPH